MEDRWKKIRYRLEWLAAEGVARFIPMLPRRVCVWLAGRLGALAYLVDGRGRAVALANLEAAFGNRYTPAERKRIARASYQHFARTMLDLFWAPRLNAENWRKYIKLEGAEEFLKLTDGPGPTTGTTALCIHKGNWEWASIGCGFANLPGFIVAENFKNELLSEVFNSRRQLSGQTIISQDKSLLRMLKVVKRRGRTGMLIDLTLRPDQPAVVINSFGMECCVTYLHAVLRDRGGARLVPLEGINEPDGTCRVILHPPLEFPPDATEQEVAQGCWDFWEAHIRQEPERWLWTYKHWRYKPKEARRPYPFYANVSSRFEKLRLVTLAPNT